MDQILVIQSYELRFHLFTINWDFIFLFWGRKKGDDMGLSDIGSYGGEVQKRNLDALARGWVGRYCPINCKTIKYPVKAPGGVLLEELLK